MRLFEIKNKMAELGQELDHVNGELTASASNPAVSMDELKAMKSKREEIQARFDILKEEHDNKAKEEEIKAQQKAVENMSGESLAIQARAQEIRRVMAGEKIQAAALTTENTGSKFLPKTVATSILHEPMTKNPVRKLSTITNITNLELPKISFGVVGETFIADGATAAELEATGDTVVFGRNKVKVYVPVSETVLAATDTNLVQVVEDGLRSALAQNERANMFKATGELSFYGNSIKEVEGDTLYQAIRDAYADLHEDYRANAKIMMRYVDYIQIVETLANGNATLYGAQPEQILGAPVEFCDSAVNPIVGDFSYSHINYDPNTLYETDKDILTGINRFVLTAWYDHKIKLKSAFRIAKKKLV